MRAERRLVNEAVLTMAQLLGVVAIALVSASATDAPRGYSQRATLSLTESIPSPATLHNDGCLVLRDPSAPHDVKLEVWGPNAVRVRIVPAGGSFRDDLVSALVPRAAGAVAECATADLGGSRHAQAVTSGNLRVEVGADGLLSFTRVSDGKLLLAEKTLRWLGPAVPTPRVPGGWLGLNMTFKATPGERFYGLGQHKSGQLDNAGLSFDLSPRNTEILIPVAHSSLGYSILVNLPGFGTVDFAEDGIAWKLQTVLQADFWVATTAAPSEAAAVSPWAQLQAAFANATGHAPVYPEWATGYWQCKNRYHNQTQVMDIARGYTQRGYPIALLIIDYFSWAPEPLGDESLPAECWPDPAGMVTELTQMGIELMLSPYFHSVTGQSKNYPKADAQGLLVDGADGKPTDIAYGGAYLYDLFQPAARAYAWDAVESGYIKPYGLHHWWLDCDEPCGGDMTQLIYRNGSWPASFVGAAYPHMVNQMVYEGTMQDNPNLDNVYLGRSAWAGSQRFGAAVWSGDTSSNWENFNQQFRAGLNFVMSGIPYWTTDIGGYNGGNISSPSFRQLIVRWFQWGAFCPIFRSHGRRSGTLPQDDSGRCGRTGASNEIWNFGPEAEAAIAKVMRIREQLRPYIMEQYRAASEMGRPVMTPMFFDFWEDSVAATIDDQMMFGPDFLVAPVLVEDATERFVYLPKLPQPFLWENHFTGETVNTTASSVNISVPTPLDTFPLFRKHKAVCYPPALPPPLPPPPPSPPKVVTCGATCDMHPSTDHAGTGHIAEATCASFPKCCALCKANNSCGAFVWGPKFAHKEAGPTNPNTCFMLQPTNLTKHANGRAFGCVRS